ncbi:hypothetical protein EDB85DRAFT_1899193 [Lactarius pseudohatsudake]|nr:hypothetical protein EDB85DRAFT_1899193 [Lactarius pseudohatsudake]
MGMNYTSTTSQLQGRLCNGRSSAGKAMTALLQISLRGQIRDRCPKSPVPSVSSGATALRVQQSLLVDKGQLETKIPQVMLGAYQIECHSPQRMGMGEQGHNGEVVSRAKSGFPSTTCLCNSKIVCGAETRERGARKVQAVGQQNDDNDSREDGKEKGGDGNNCIMAPICLIAPSSASIQQAVSQPSRESPRTVKARITGDCQALLTNPHPDPELRASGSNAVTSPPLDRKTGNTRTSTMKKLGCVSTTRLVFLNETFYIYVITSTFVGHLMEKNETAGIRHAAELKNEKREKITPVPLPLGLEIKKSMLSRLCASCGFHE